MERPTRDDREEKKKEEKEERERTTRENTVGTMPEESGKIRGKQEKKTKER